MSGVELDVVIPTRDRPAQLNSCLTALGRQSFDRFGVIVVDDGGLQEAERLVPEAMRRNLSIRFVRNDVSIGPGASRNHGVEMSDAPSLVFLDDDCTAGGELIARHRAVLAVGHPVVSLGPILSPPGRRLRAWTHWDADRLQRKYERIWTGEVKPGWTHLYTGNVGIRRTDFLAVGGFDLRFARQEDIELGYRLHRLGCRFEFDPAAIVWHDSDRSLRTWIGIPSASARFDVLMDRLDPDSGRLAAMQDGLRDRHRVLRLTRRLVSGSMTGRCTVAAAIGAGLALHALRFDSVALAAFSVAWDLRYVDALQAATCPETAP